MASSTRSVPTRVGIRSVFGRLEGHRDVTLRRQVVDLVRLHLLNDADEIGRVGQIAVMQLSRTSLSCGS